jgi:sugar phosphate isomerase/epimerase
MYVSPARSDDCLNPVSAHVFSLFTKPWRLPLHELGPLVRSLGFDHVELPVRPGCTVSPVHPRRNLGSAQAILAESGISIASIAGEPTAGLIAACGELGIPIIRMLVPIPDDQRFWPALRQVQHQWDALLPALEQAGVTLGIQNHCGRYLNHASHLWCAIGHYDPRLIAAVWDPAHNALQGEDPDVALDMLEGRVAMISLKNAVWRRRNDAAAPEGDWETYWTTGAQGLANWRRVAQELRDRSWTGTICLHAEYTQEHLVEPFIREDLQYARSVFAAPAATQVALAR